MSEILLAVFSALFTLATAYLGVHVTIHPAETDKHKLFYKIAFWACGVIACTFIGIQSYRGVKTQSALQIQLNKIQKNTETPPPTPVVNVYPATQAPPPHQLASLKDRTNKLAAELDAFERDRVKHGPPGVTITNKMSPEEQQELMAPSQAYNQQTYEIYNKRFAVRVVTIVQEFKAKGMDVSEIENCAANGFCNPTPIPVELRAFASRLDADGNVRR